MRELNLLNNLENAAEVRRLVTEFFSDTYVTAPDAPKVQAKVHMRTNEHNAYKFDRVVVSIRYYHTNTDGSRFKLGNVAMSLDAVLSCSLLDFIPSIDNYMRGKTGLEDEALYKMMVHVSKTVKAYAEAFAELGPEPTAFVESRERESLKKFLSGETQHEVADHMIRAWMPVDRYDYHEFKDEHATIEISRMDGSLVGRMVTKMGHIYKSGIQSYLEEFELNYSELIDIDDFMMHKLNRFEALGGKPFITPDPMFEPFE